MPQPRILAREQIQPELIRSWLQICDREHRGVCHDESIYNKYLTILAPKLDLILIDVKGKRLVKATAASRYMALSYVWGQTSATKTKLSNFPGLQELGALDSKEVYLPRTILDAMKLVENIGESYLWADLLCIIQDDPNKVEQFMKMDQIYASAQLTIVALTGSNADVGLPGVNNNLQNEDNKSAKVHLGSGWKMSSEPLSLYEQLLKSHHFTRGWTMQEVMLSPRCLFIAEDRIYFKCRGMLEIEGKTSLGPQNYDFDLETMVTFAPSESRIMFINAYQSYIEQYTKRNLTFESDIANAFTGIISALSKWHSRWSDGYLNFLGALPTRFLSHALLWTSVQETASRRIIKPGKSSELFRFPSWSWSGWTGPASYGVVGLWKLTDHSEIHSLLGVPAFRDDRAAEKDVQHILWHDSSSPSLKCIGSCSIVLGDGKYGRKICAKHIDSPTIIALSSGPVEIRRLLPILELQASCVPALGFSFGMSEVKACDSIASGGYRHKNLKQAGTKTLIRLLPILDLEGRQCGCLMNPPFSLPETVQPDFVMIAISHFRAFNWVDGIFGEHYARETDGVYDGGGGKCRCIMNVMLLKQDGDVFERVAIGQIHPKAWSDAAPTRKMFILI